MSGTFFAGMGIIVAIIIIMILVGEERFNALLNTLKCAHQYKYYNRQGNEDNKDSHVAKCVKCGKKIIIEE